MIHDLPGLLVGEQPARCIAVSFGNRLIITVAEGFE
jgi:hypothetical protein